MPTAGRMALDRYGLYRPAGQPPLARADPTPPSRAPARSRRTPPTRRGSPTAASPARRTATPRLGRFEAAYVGHAAEAGFRDGGQLRRHGQLGRGRAPARAAWSTASRTWRPAGADGEPGFAYRISRSEAELRAGARSRYYPVELSGVLRRDPRDPRPLRRRRHPLLRQGDPPAPRRRGPADLAERIAFTLGLFCGHMKSARMVESFAWQMGARARRTCAASSTARRTRASPANWYVAELELADGSVRRRHWWDMADGDWGAGFFQSPACDACDDVVAETADVSFGDAWVEPYSSDGRGTNVVVVRSPAMLRLIEAGRADGRARASSRSTPTSSRAPRPPASATAARASPTG